jgi:aspartate racemase
VKTIGLVGGLGPESTLDYYRLIVEGYGERTGREGSPHLVVDSVELPVAVRLLQAGDTQGLTTMLLESLRRLARAEAEIGALGANTPHVVFEDLAPRSPLPLVSIVTSTRDAAVAHGLRRLGLIGTRFTMTARFYPDVMQRAGLALVTPPPAEQDEIHAAYMGELVRGVFRDATRERLLDVVRRMRARDGVDGVILGGTELPLLLREAQVPDVAWLDTTRIHVSAILDAASA